MAQSTVSGGARHSVYAMFAWHGTDWVSWTTSFFFRCPLSPWSHYVFELSFLFWSKLSSTSHCLSSLCGVDLLLLSRPFGYVKRPQTLLIIYLTKVTNTCLSATLWIVAAKWAPMTTWLDSWISFIQISSNIDGWILSTCHLNTQFATNRFGLSLHTFSLVTWLLFGQSVCEEAS